MRPEIVVVSVPVVGFQLDIPDNAEDVRVEHRLAIALVELLDVAVLCRLAGLCVQYGDVVALAPLLELLGDELGAVVASDVLGLAMEPYHLLQGPYQPLRGERHRLFLGQRDPVVVVDDVEHAELPAALQRVAHEVYGPRDVRLLRLLQRVLRPGGKALLQLGTLLIVHVFVNAVHLLVIPCIPIAAQPLEDLPEAVAVLGS